MRNPQQDVPDHALIVATFARSTAGPAATAPPGAVVRIGGTVAPAGEMLTAPLSGRPCVWFRSITHQGPSFVESSLTGEPRIVFTPHPFVRSDMRFAHDPRTQDHETAAPVRVRDAAGAEVVVDLRGVDVDAVTVAVDSVEERDDGSRIMRREWIIEAGTPVFVLGEVAPGPTLRATPATAAVLSAHAEAEVFQRSQGYVAAGGRTDTAGALVGSSSGGYRQPGLSGPSRMVLVTVGAVVALVVLVVLVVLLAS